MYLKNISVRLIIDLTTRFSNGFKLNLNWTVEYFLCAIRINFCLIWLSNKFIISFTLQNVSLRQKINLLIKITVTCIPYNNCRLILITIFYFFLFFYFCKRGWVSQTLISNCIKANLKPHFSDVNSSSIYRTSQMTLMRIFESFFF